MLIFIEKEDEKLREDVVNELKWDPSVTSGRVGVTADAGIITLRGRVPHFSERSKALEATQRVSGVRGVADEIEVDLLGDFEHSDAAIAEAALSTLQWSYSVREDVKVSVDNGWLTLTGKAEWEYQRKAAESSGSHINGVRGITNEIKIKPVAEAPEIKTRIEEALKRLARSDARALSVSVEGSSVLLTGKVNSISERENACAAAWNAPGVMAVSSNLEIGN